MAVTITDFYQLLPAVTLRATEAITGDTTGEVRQLLDNATWGYAQSRPVLVQAGGIEDVSDWEDVGGAYIEIINAWVQLETDGDKIVFNIAGQGVTYEIDVYDNVARSVALYNSGVLTIGAQGETSMSTGALSDLQVLIVVNYKATSAPTAGKVFTFMAYQDSLVVGDLPT